MFCPSCGTEERQRSQFCRACGADLRPARTGIEKNDTLNSAAISAREEIGRAVAGKIREVQTAKDLAKVVEKVLPEIEKFLEPPEEQRLRRMRWGVMLGVIGMAIMLCMFLLCVVVDKDLLPLISIGALPFFIGVGMVLNGLLLSTPAQAGKRLSDSVRENPAVKTAPPNPERAQLSFQPTPRSVTEHTTHHLGDEDAPLPRAISE